MLRYFADNETVFNTVAAQGHPVLLEALSASTYPDGTPANTNGSFAEYSLDANGTLESASMAMWVRSISPYTCSETSVIKQTEQIFLSPRLL